MRAAIGMRQHATGVDRDDAEPRRCRVNAGLTGIKRGFSQHVYRQEQSVIQVGLLADHYRKA